MFEHWGAGDARRAAALVILRSLKSLRNRMFELWSEHDPQGVRTHGREGLWPGRSGTPASDRVFPHREAAYGPVAPSGAREQAQQA